MENKSIRIGLVMKSLQADFFKVMQQGAEEFVNETGCCALTSVGTDSQTETEKQIALVDRLAAEGMDAIVVVPIDSKALVRPVADAAKKGITVVNIDIRLDSGMLRGQSTLYIIHGNGTGALRTAIHKHLRGNRMVKSFRLGRYGEGESGVTIVEFK